MKYVHRPLSTAPIMRAIAALCLAIGVLGALSVAPAQAGPCASAYNPGNNTTIPNCVDQIQAAVKYSDLDTKGWAYYCTGANPYYWGQQVGYADAYSKNNNCFTISENTTNEKGNSSKFDATITNWCLKSETLVVTLACSSTPTP